MTIKAHCMGTEFPKRDTDGPGYKWVSPKEFYEFTKTLPSAADLDALAEEQRVKGKTS